MSEPGSHTVRLVQALRARGRELAWLEFKENNKDPDLIGRLLSALSNGATLEGRSCGYVVWGVEDATRDVVGTDFDPGRAKVGAQELESWLLLNCRPRIHLRFAEALIEGKWIMMEIIAEAINQDDALAIRFLDGKRRSPRRLHSQPAK